MTLEAQHRRRRDHSPELKRELVARSLVPGASVAAIALEAGINANLLFTWRRAHLQAMKGTAASTTRAASGGAIEVELNGARVRVRGVPDEAALRCVLKTLRALA